MTMQDAKPAWHGLLLVLADLVADDSTDRSTTDRSHSAASCEHGPADRSCTRTDRRALIPFGHIAAARAG